MALQLWAGWPQGVEGQALVLGPCRTCPWEHAEARDASWDRNREARLGWLPVPCGDHLPVMLGIPVGRTLCRPPETSAFSLARATGERGWERGRVASAVRPVDAAAPQG